MANAQAVANAIGSGNANAAAEAIASSASVILRIPLHRHSWLSEHVSCISTRQVTWCVLMGAVAFCRIPMAPTQQRKLWRRHTLRVSLSVSCRPVNRQLCRRQSL